MIKHSNRPSRLGIRVENERSWILTDRLTGSDVGGVTYQHNSRGAHYQPWLVVDGARTNFGIALPQLGQAAQEIEEELRKRTGPSAKRD